MIRACTRLFASATAVIVACFLLSACSGTPKTSGTRAAAPDGTLKILGGVPINVSITDSTLGEGQRAVITIGFQGQASGTVFVDYHLHASNAPEGWTAALEESPRYAAIDEVNDNATFTIETKDPLAAEYKIEIDAWSFDDLGRIHYVSEANGSLTIEVSDDHN